MKKLTVLVLVLSILALTFVLAGCNDTAPVSQASESEVTAAAEDPVIPDGDDDPAIPDDDDIVVDPPAQTFGIKEEILSEVGLSFGELSQRYGDEKSRDGASGGLWITFENGYGSFCFGEYRDEVADGDKCTNIACPFNLVFPDVSGPLSADDLARIYNLVVVSTGEDMHDGCFYAIFTHFTPGGAYTVRVNHEFEDAIDDNAWVFISATN